MRKFLVLLLCLPLTLWAQSSDQILEELEDETTLGGDIFSDFNEDLESSQVLEDERFYRYGRFFSVNLGGGFTTFTGNRGRAYDDNPPTFHLSLNYFLDFQKAIALGVEYSRHTMILNSKVNGFREKERLGAVNSDMTRVFVGYKYYMETADLGTAITYSNPYIIGRMEYWYQSVKYLDHKDLPRRQGHGEIGTAIGAGFEFPIELKASYFGVEGLFHVVNFFDKYTQDYAQIPGDKASTYGFPNLDGNVLSLMFTYNFTW